MRKAYVTVYFSLVVSVCMSIVSLLITGIRENALRMRTREVTQISLASTFGEYNRYLWDRYGLIFVDSGYDSGVNSTIIAEDHFIECMNKNFNESGIRLWGERDLLKLECKGAEMDKVRLATDAGCSPIKRQAIEHIKYKTKIEYITDAYNKLLDYQEKVYDFEEMKEKYEEAKETFDGTEKSAFFSEISIPSDAVFWEQGDKASFFSILNIAMKDVSSVSSVSINEDFLFSNREINIGNFGVKEGDSFSDKILLREYFLNVLASYYNRMDEACLAYELEYLICGNNTDIRNLEELAMRILTTREGANYLSFKNDLEKVSKVETAAGIISAIIGNPELYEPINTIITTIWVSWESVTDLKSIFAGKKIPFIKTGEEWETGFSLSSLFTQKEGNYEKGLDYVDYLRMFLLIEDDNSLMKRFSNILELNVRENTEQNNFKIDSCFDACEMTAYVESMYDRKYIVTRVYDCESY